MADIGEGVSSSVKRFQFVGKSFKMNYGKVLSMVPWHHVDIIQVSPFGLFRGERPHIPSQDVELDVGHTSTGLISEALKRG